MPEGTAATSIRIDPTNMTSDEQRRILGVLLTAGTGQHTKLKKNTPYYLGESGQSVCLTHAITILCDAQGEYSYLVSENETEGERLGKRKILGQGGQAKVDAIAGEITLRKNKNNQRPVAVYLPTPNAILRREMIVDEEEGEKAALQQFTQLKTDSRMAITGFAIKQDLPSATSPKKKIYMNGRLFSGINLEKALDLDKKEPITDKQLAIFCYAYLRAVQEQIHDKGWLHLDIKPANTIVEWPLPEDKLPLINFIDWGIAIKKTEVATLTPLALWKKAGTPYFQSPESEQHPAAEKKMDGVEKTESVEIGVIEKRDSYAAMVTLLAFALANANPGRETIEIYDLVDASKKNVDSLFEEPGWNMSSSFLNRTKPIFIDGLKPTPAARSNLSDLLGKFSTLLQEEMKIDSTTLPLSSMHPLSRLDEAIEKIPVADKFKKDLQDLREILINFEPSNRDNIAWCTIELLEELQREEAPLVSKIEAVKLYYKKVLPAQVLANKQCYHLSKQAARIMGGAIIGILIAAVIGVVLLLAPVLPALVCIVAIAIAGLAVISSVGAAIKASLVINGAVATKARFFRSVNPLDESLAAIATTAYTGLTTKAAEPAESKNLVVKEVGVAIPRVEPPPSCA